MIDRFRLPLTFDAAALTADLEALSAEGWIPHFNQGFYDGDWSGLVLRGPVEGADSLAATGDAFADTPLLDLCPGVRAVLATLDCPLRSVRLLRLGRERQVALLRAMVGALGQARAPGQDRLFVKFDAETGAQPYAGAHVLRNGRLKKGETHSKALIRAARGLVAACFATVSQEASATCGFPPQTRAGRDFRVSANASMP